MSSTPIRLPGLASGIETDDIIKAQLSNEQKRVDSAKQEKQLSIWRQETYRDIISQVKDFSEKYFTVGSPNSIISSKNFSTQNITSSNSSVISAIAGPNANMNGNLKIDVNNIATSPKKISDKIEIGGLNATQDTKLSELGLTEDVTIEVSVNGEAKEIKLTSDMTLQQVGKEISSATNGTLTGNYSELTGKFTIQGSNTGENSNFQIVGIKDALGNDANNPSTINSLTSIGLSIDAAAISGTNASVTITTDEGDIINLSKESNTFSIDGITYTANGVGSSNLSSSTNVDNVVENVKSFVKDYNELVEKIDKLLSEKKSYDYKPLTEEQKKEMSKEEIETWEKKSKQGILRNDVELKYFVKEIKEGLFGKVEGSNEILDNFGISSPKDYRKNGQLEINEDKLKESLEDNPNKLYEYFNKNSDVVSEQGIMLKTRDVLNKYAGKYDSVLVKKSGYKNTASDSSNYFTKQITRQEERIKILQKALTKRENILYKQFARMESQMSKLNSQFSMIAGGAQ